jgi:hypothetical protein
MYRFAAAVLALLAVADAFAPASHMTTSSPLKMKFEDALGEQPPLGFWDPLNLLKDADEVIITTFSDRRKASSHAAPCLIAPIQYQDRFDRLRYMEVKHGRISMLAILGHMVTTAGVRLPGDIAHGVPFTSVKAGLAAFDTIPSTRILQIIIFIGLMELGFASIQDSLQDLCLDFAGWSEETEKKMRAIELNNGRAAQIGIVALMVLEKLDYNPYIISDLLGFPVPFNQ